MTHSHKFRDCSTVHIHICKRTSYSAGCACRQEVHAQGAENKDTHANYSHASIYTLCMRCHKAASSPLLDPSSPDLTVRINQFTLFIHIFHS